MLKDELWIVMTRKSKLFAIGGLTVLLGVGLLARGEFEEDAVESRSRSQSKMSPTMAASSEKIVPEKMSQVLKRIEVESRAKAAKHVQAIKNEEAALEDAGGYTSMQLETARGHVNEMVAVAGTIYTPKLRSETMGKLVEDPVMVQLLSDVLTDIDFAKKAFGPDQGKMRHFAIETLGHAAKTGDTKPLEDTLEQVTSNLSANDGEIDRGEIEDLSGLVMALAKNVPEDRLTPELVTELGFSSQSDKGVRDAWVNSLFIGSWKRTGSLDSARAMATKVFSKGQG